MSKELTPLEALAKLEQNDVEDTRLLNYQLYDIIEVALKEGEKNKKALEIIKNKKVDMKELLGFFEWGEGFYYYNEYRCKEEKLTHEEYDFLKEVLK